MWVITKQEVNSVRLTSIWCSAPSSGGQYHWVSEFAPPDMQKVLSYCSGWLSALGIYVDSWYTADKLTKRFPQAGKLSSRALLLRPVNLYSYVLHWTTLNFKRPLGMQQELPQFLLAMYLHSIRQGTLMTIAVAAFSALFNIVLAKRLPMFEGIVLLFHILGFFAVRFKAVAIDQSCETKLSTGSHPFVGACS